MIVDILIIDYGLGNLNSILNMLIKIGVNAKISSSPEDIFSADKLILPGVGAYDAGINNIRKNNLFDVLNKAVLVHKKPVLGICLGMQLLGKYSDEGKEQGFGWIDFYCKKFEFKNDKILKIPHVGWNYVEIVHNNNLIFDSEEKSRFYFVHSYHAVCKNYDNVIMQTEYGYKFASAIHKDNIYGVQFHPEKSHRFGMQLLKNFVENC